MKDKSKVLNTYRDFVRLATISRCPKHAAAAGYKPAPQLGSSSLLNQQSTCLIKYDVIRFTLLRIEAERLRAIAQTTCCT